MERAKGDAEGARRRLKENFNSRSRSWHHLGTVQSFLFFSGKMLSQTIGTVSILRGHRISPSRHKDRIGSATSRGAADRQIACKNAIPRKAHAGRERGPQEAMALGGRSEG